MGKVAVVCVKIAKLLILLIYAYPCYKYLVASVGTKTVLLFSCSQYVPVQG
jgi:hypothetical protein